MFNGCKYLQIDNSTTSAASRDSTMYSTASGASNMSSTASSVEDDWDNLQGYCLQRQYLGKYSQHFNTFKGIKVKDFVITNSYNGK